MRDMDILLLRGCEIKIDELKENFNKMSIEIEKKEKELRQREQAANLSTHTPEPSQRLNFFYDNDDDDDDEESTIPLNEFFSQIPQSIAITPVLPTMEPKDSLIMGNGELSTIPEKESDEVIKSSVEDLVPIPSAVLRHLPCSDSDYFLRRCSEENFKIYSNPLFEFDDEYISSDVNPLFNEVLEDIESEDSFVSKLDVDTKVGRSLIRYLRKCALLASWLNPQSVITHMSIGLPHRLVPFWPWKTVFNVAMAHSSWPGIYSTIHGSRVHGPGDEELREFTSEYYIPSALHPVVPAASASIADFPEGKVGVYTRFFEFANQRVPLSLFMCNVLNHYRLHISQLHCIGAAKITNFEVNCRLLAIHPTVHLFRAFYHTSWSNGWVSFAKRAGRLQCYTEKLDALRRWREMFFWVDDALVPWDFAFYTQGSLPRDERPPPGSYSMEDAELINENRIPINAYSEAFLCHMGISRNYFQSPEEVPTFIGDDGQGGCLSFLLPRLVVMVHLIKPKLVTKGVRPLRDSEEPLLESTAGRTMELVLEQPEFDSTDVLAPTTLHSVPGATEEPARLDTTSVGSSEDADVAGAESEAREVDFGLKRKRATSDDGAGTSKRMRHVSIGLSTSTEEETPDSPPTLAAKEVTETPPPNVEATSDSSAPVTHAAQSPPPTSPFTANDISRRDRETCPKVFEGMPVDQLMEEFDMVTAQQAALVAQLRARFSSERGQSVQKEEEILLLKTQLADAQAEAESSRSYAQKLAEEKMALLVKRVEGLLEKQEEKLRKLSIEYDEELYPHILSAIAERRWLISHGLRLAAMSTLESQEVKQSFGDVVKCALARGKAEAVEELHEKKLLTMPAAQVPGYNHNAYEELVAAMEAMKL
ncbi:hypothetical protein Tco_0498645, partial [Tanacetum coccineum]